MLLNLNPPAQDKRQALLDRRQILREIKTVVAVIHTVEGIHTESEVAKIADITVERLQRVKKSPRWGEAWEWYTGDPVTEQPEPKLIAKKTETPKTRETSGSYREHKQALYEAQGGFCNGCRYRFHTFHLTFDHVVAKSKGGSDDLENLQLLCQPCNNLKGKRTPEFLIKKLKEQGISVSPNTYNYFEKPNRLRRFGARAVFAGFFFVVTALMLVQP